MAYVIQGSCVLDTACLDVCPVDCISPMPSEAGFESAEMLFIDPATCVHCNACAEACPVTAIVADSDLNPTQSHWLGINAAYFGRIP